MKSIDRVGQTYGRLRVLSVDGKKGRATMCMVLCACGTEKRIHLSSITCGGTKSCGCLRRENRHRFRHGYTCSETKSVGGKKFREYQVWRSMVSRCHNKNSTAYHQYGARGIHVCDRWRSFTNFLEDMGRRPFERAQLDRIDNGRGYEPGNVRWTTSSTNSNNRRGNRHVVIDGVRMTCADASRAYGVVSGVIIAARLGYGWGDKEAVLTPKLPTGKKRPK